MHTLAVQEQGTSIHVEGETLLLMREGQVLRRVRLGEIHEVVLMGRVEISSGAMAALVRRGIDVVFLTVQGYYRARLVGRKSAQAGLRLAQLRRALDAEFSAGIAANLIAGKVNHQRQILLRAQRRLKDADLAVVLGRLRTLAEECRGEKDRERLRGLEGMAAALYFSQFGKLLMNSQMRFGRRTRRPPRDPVNACLSFGYALLGNVVETEVLRAGLDPLVGFFHQPAHNRPSLMLDLLEELRPLVDGLVLRMINRRQVGPGDFERRGGAELEEILAEAATGEETPAGEEARRTDCQSVLPDQAQDPRRTDCQSVLPGQAAEGEEGAGEGVFLGDAGRRVFLAEFFRRLRERLYYPPRQGAFEIRDIIREQAYHLARVIDGKEAEYVAFVPG